MKDEKTAEERKLRKEIDDWWRKFENTDDLNEKIAIIRNDLYSS